MGYLDGGWFGLIPLHPLRLPTVQEGSKLVREAGHLVWSPPVVLSEEVEVMPKNGEPVPRVRIYYFSAEGRKKLREKIGS
jgi:hypothetical protein